MFDELEGLEGLSGFMLDDEDEVVEPGLEEEEDGEEKPEEGSDEGIA